MLQIENLSLFYEQQALKALRFSFEPGRIYGLIGANGAGKSSLLKILAGIISEYQGKLLWNGQPVRRAQWQDRRFCSYAPEDVELMPYLTATEFLNMIAALRKVTGPEAGTEFYLDLLSLKSKAHELVAELSHGMRQKLAIAAALTGNPALQLYDETFNGLDTPTMHRLQQHLVQQKEAGRCIIIASHVLPLVKDWCDEVLLLQAGQIAAHLQSEALKNWPANDFPKT